MKYILFSLILSAIVLGCRKDESKNQNVCDSDNPVDTFLWFEELKNSFTNCSCEWSILQGTYMNETVVWVAMTDPLCDGFFPPPAVYDCNGEPYDFPTLKDHEEFYLYVTDREVLYRCKW